MRVRACACVGAVWFACGVSYGVELCGVLVLVYRVVCVCVCVCVSVCVVVCVSVCVCVCVL